MFPQLFSQHVRKWSMLFVGIIAILLIASGVFLILQKTEMQKQIPRVRSASQPYTFVLDKISQSADIVIRLPKGIAAGALVQDAIVFDPEIEGAWQPIERVDELAFRPKKKLRIGSYYSVSLALGEARMQKDFQVADDPKVTAAFPAVNSEAHERSEITLVFNRPMVPLTTLDAVSSDIPITITPETKGKLRWISTRNLQFIPDERLVRSSNYIVKMTAGFTSVEGLSVPEFTHAFITRPLRYAYASSGQTQSQQPIKIVFNQPFDLDRTKRELNVRRLSDNQEILVVVEYGKRSVYNQKTKKDEETTDEQQLWVYQARDRHGRAKFWDFSETYSYELTKAYPKEGDILLEELKSGQIEIPEPIESLTAESPRSKHTAPDFFDPQGKLWVNFFEPIDLEKSKIEARGLEKIEYGEKCLGGAEYNDIERCPKEPDKKRISLTFRSEVFKPSDQFEILFERLVNTDRLVLNAEVLKRTVKVYPPFHITRTVPENGAANVPVTELKICSTTPIVPAELETFQNIVKSNVPVGLWRWNDPYRIFPGNPHSPCAVGEFENMLRYGLIPKTEYRIELSLTDDFGQTVSIQLAFTSGDVPAYSRTITSMQKGYTVTSPERTTFTYAVENLEYVDVTLCQVTAEQFLRYTLQRPSVLEPPSGFSCSKKQSRRIDLPKRYWARNYIQLKISDFLKDSRGQFILTVTNPLYRTPNLVQFYNHTLISVTRLAVQEKKVEWQAEYPESQGPYPEHLKKALGAKPQNLYWVTESGTLKNISGAVIQLFQKKIFGDSPQLIKSIQGKTDTQGVALLEAIPDLYGAVVTQGDDTAVVVADMDRLQWASPAQSSERAYLYTDRPIYRPGHEVFLKGIHRVGVDGAYEIFREKKADVKVYSSKDEVVFQQSLDVSENGTFHTTFTLPPDASLGTYRIEALSGIGFFDVEEYVPAAFKVETRTDHKEYIAGESAQLTLDANYYFGVPVEGGEVEYSLVAQDYYFDRYTDEYFQFGSGWYWSFNEGYGDQYLLRGRAVLSSQGKADIVQNLDFNAFFKDKELERSKIFTLFAAIKNLNGQAVSTQKSFIVHRGEFYLGLNLEKTFLGKGALVHARIKSVDVQGKPRGVSDVSAKIYKIRWEAARRKEVDGGYYYRSERKTDLVEERMLDTDKNGNAQFDFLAGQEGEFELVLETKDSRKNLIKTTQEFYVSGPGDVEVRQTNNETLELATDKGEVHVGTRVKVIIKSPYAQAKALVALERGTIFQYEILDIDQNLYEYTFEVKKEHIPNIYFTAFLLSPEPEIKYGQINYQVNTKEVSLDIAVTSNKKTYLPGEDVTLDFRITDGSGKPVQTELSAAVVDMSVLALKGNPKKNPLVFFYDGQPLAVMTSSNIKNILHEAEIPTGTKGGGGVEPEDLARKKRGVFKDTAYWHGVITTDREGRARVTFPLPDNLTTWQVESVGVTRDTKLGAGYQEFMSRKDLMVIPLQPRFVVPGDEFLIGAKVFNETKKTQKLAVSLDPRALELLDKAETSVSVKPREAETVYFSVRAPETQVEGTHPFAVSAKNKEYEDTVEQSIPITRNDTYEATATANYSKNPEEREYIFIPENVIKNKGGVTVNTSATLAVFLSDALKYLFQYPYGCSEQIASKLSAIAIVKRGLNLPNMAEQFSLPMVEFQGREYTVDEVVTKGLAQIMQNQRSVGGFAYYPEMPDADFYLTLHVVNTLIDLKAAGYSVDSQMLERATEYLNREIFDIQKYGDSKDLRILTAYTVSRVDRKQVDPGLASWVESYRDDKKFIREDISSTSLSHLALYLAYMNSSKKLKNEVYQILGNRIDIDGRGAHMRSGNQFLWSFYETPVQNTALLLKAFAIDQRDTAVLDKVVRWLLKSRAKDGAWGSTHNTLSVIDAFTEYLAWKQETESEFRLSLVLNEQVRDTFEFNKDTILKTFTYAFPISDFREQTLESLRFLKVNKNNLPNFYYYDAHLKYYFPIDQIPARDEGFTVSRAFYAIDDKEMRKPLSEAKQGEVVKGRLTIIVPEARNFVSVEDFIPAGGEIVNFKLATEAATVQAFGDNQNQSSEDFWRGYYDTREDNEPVHQKLYPDAVESHDDRLFLFKQSLNPGVYEYDYYFRALIPGKFHHLPAVVSEMYFPETFGRTRGEYFEVRK